MAEQRLAIIVTAQDLASGKLGKVRSELNAMGTSGKIASVGIGAGMLAVNKGEQALGNLKNRLTSLAAPLAMIGLSGGLFTIGGALEQGIAKANNWGLAIEKLQGMTSDSAEALSGYLALTDKFNISEDVATSIVGFEEKAIGKLQMATVKATAAGKSAALQSLETQKLQIQETGGKTTLINKLISEQKARDALAAASGEGAVGTNKLVALQKQYGVTLADSKGQALSFTTVLLNVADAYSKASTASQKAKTDALAAAVFGRGYAQLVPILKLGRQGILDAEAAAKDLGLTLSGQNVADLAKFRESTREAGDAVSGLELQLGLAAAPDLTEVFKSFSTYMGAHQSDVKHMFSEGLSTAEALVGFVTGTVVPAISSIAGAASGIWNSIPGPMKDLLVKGFVADRTMKFFFGMSPIHAVVSLAEGALQKGLGSLVGGIFTKGSLANPMIVKDISGGLGGNETGALASGGIWGTVGKVIGGAFAIVAVAAIADAIYPLISPGGGYQNRVKTGQDNLPADQLSWPWGPKNTPKVDFDLGPIHVSNLLGGDSGIDRVPNAVPPGSQITTPTNLSGAGMTADRRAALGAQDLFSGLTARNELSGGLTAQLKGGKVGATAAGLADSITGVFAQSTGRSFNSMTSAMGQLKDLQARYLSQGDTKLAASIGGDLRALGAYIAEAIAKKQFTVTGILDSPSLTRNTPVTIRDVVTKTRTGGAIGPVRSIGRTAI